MRKYYTHLILIGLGLILYFMSNFQRVAVPGAIFDTLQADLSLNAPSVTSLSACFMYSYAVSLLLCGILTDRYGAVKVILVGAIFFSLGSLIFPNTSNIYILYLSRILMGAGAASFYMFLIQEAKKCFPDKYFSISVSLMLITGYLGGVCANAPFIITTKYIHWRHILNILAVITLFASIFYCIYRTFLHKIPVNEHAKFSLEPFKEVLANKSNHSLFIFGGLNYGLYYVIQTVIGVKFLKDYINLSATNASAILSLMIVVAGIAGLSFASISSFLSNRRVIFMKTVCIMTSCFFAIISLFLLFEIKTKLIVFMILLIALGGAMSPLIIPIVHATNKYDVKSTAISVMNCCFFLSVGILGTIVGHLLDMYPPTLVSNGHLIYSSKSYFLVFITFFILSLVEMYNVFKLKDV